VLSHYALIIAISRSRYFAFLRQYTFFNASHFLAGGVGFMVVTGFNYWPTYYSEFLPRLDTTWPLRKSGKKTIAKQWENQQELAMLVIGGRHTSKSDFFFS